MSLSRIFIWITPWPMAAIVALAGIGCLVSAWLQNRTAHVSVELEANLAEVGQES